MNLMDNPSLTQLNIELLVSDATEADIDRTTVFPAVVALAQAWSTPRGQGRTVKFKGKGIEFEGSLEELQRLLATLEKGKKK